MMKFSMFLIVAITISGISAGFILDRAEVIKDKILEISEQLFSSDKSKTPTTSSTILHQSAEPSVTTKSIGQQPTAQRSDASIINDSVMFAPAKNAVVTEGPLSTSTDSRHLIDAPARSCPEGEKMDSNRECRPVF